MQGNCSEQLLALTRRRDAGRGVAGGGGGGGGGGRSLPPFFGRSVNHIPTRLGRVYPPHYYCPPPKKKYLDLTSPLTVWGQGQWLTIMKFEMLICTELINQEFWDMHFGLSLSNLVSTRFTVVRAYLFQPITSQV